MWVELVGAITNRGLSMEARVKPTCWPTQTAPEMLTIGGRANVLTTYSDAVKQQTKDEFCSRRENNPQSKQVKESEGYTFHIVDNS